MLTQVKKYRLDGRAAFLAFICLVGNVGLWGFLILFKQVEWGSYLNLFVLAVVAPFVLVSAVKYFPPMKERDLSGIQKYDERDIMFARNNLQYHPQLAEKYYAAHPEKRPIDEKIQAKPELGEPGHRFYDTYFSPVFDAAFTYLHRTRDVSTGEVAPGKKEIDAGKMTDIITAVARLYGAVDVGITPLKPFHTYSHYGRQPGNWGKEMAVPHAFAIVIVVAMEVGMMKFAPALPVILESSKRYVESAKIAPIEAFCAGCKKCADNCPSQSITSGEEPVSRGFRHWSIGWYVFISHGTPSTGGRRFFWMIYFMGGDFPPPKTSNKFLAGKLSQVCRSWYMIEKPWRKHETPLPVIANSVVHPSYLSLDWALQYYDMIPEHVPNPTSITTGRGTRFEAFASGLRKKKPREAVIETCRYISHLKGEL